MTRALGLDGARGGWAAALVDDGRVSWLRLSTMAEALQHDVDVVGVDMPIGLPDRGRRECDVLAKGLLGQAHPRVFLTPPREVLHAATYAEANLLHRELSDGLGMSVQTWHLLPKVREVDAVAGDPRLVEVHPELSFAALAGGDPLPSKRSAAGRMARITALRSWLPDLHEVPRGDDALDALAVAWSALRWADGTARVLPARPPSDRLGRPMRIVT